MRTILTLLALFLMVLCAGAQDANLVRQQQLALQYAATTGKTPAECLNAVQVWEWCSAYPQGSVMGSVKLDAQATAAQKALAQAFLTTPNYKSGGLANRPARPIGRSMQEHPERRLEIAARQGVGGAAGVGAGGLMQSRIDGEFTGFEYEKVFKLMNGQVWQQADFTLHYHFAFSPQVMIYHAAGGTMMKVDGVEKPVRVMQLK